MKSLFTKALLSAVLIPHLIFGQGAKEVYGSFEAGCKVYNYHFKKASNGINAFAIYEIGKQMRLLELDDKKVDTTIKFVNTIIKVIDDTLATASITNEDQTKFSALRGVLDSLQNIMSDVQLRIKQVRELSEKRDLVDSLYKWSSTANVDSMILNMQVIPPKEGFYSVASLFSALTDFMNLIKGEEAPYYSKFNDFELGVFKRIFNSYMEPQKKEFSDVCKYDDEKISSQVFYEIKARLDFLDDEPVTAYLKLKTKKIRVYIENENTKDNKVEKPKKNKKLNKDSLQHIVVPPLKEGKDYLDFMVDDVNLEFEDGTIKNIFCDLSYLDNAGNRISDVRFRNIIPISVSGKFDPDVFEQNKIFAATECEVYRTLRNHGVNTAGNLQKDGRINKNGNCRNLFFLLSDLITYKIVPDNDKEDYSPANNVYNINEQNPVQLLKKEKRSKILVLKVFSDFVGIKDDQPNGLVQAEASKKINLLTWRKQIGFNYLGWLTYIEPKVVLSKIETNNKYLYLDKSQLDTVISAKEGIKAFNVDALQVMQYANFSILCDINVFKFNSWKAKSNFQFNAHFGYSRTAVSDSIVVEDSIAQKSATLRTDNLNSRLLGASLQWDFKPDSRYGFSLGYEINFVKPYSDSYLLVDQFKNPVQTVSLESFIKTNNDGGKLFFRTRFNRLFKNANRNFMQIQLGYALDVFKSH